MRSVDAGVRITELASQFSLSPPTRAYTSPLKRCGETLSSALVGMNKVGAIPLNIEVGLVESINEDWYRSWGAPGADSTWGGPPTCRKGTPVDVSDMDPRVLEPAGSLYNTTEMMNSYDTVRAPVLGDHDVMFDATPYNWNNLETKKNQHTRLRSVVEGLAKKHLGESLVVCSHGGPCTHIYEELTGERWEQAGPCGYTAISVYEYEVVGEELKWKNLKHLEKNDDYHV
ncbi:hypothetical protein TrRE_jg9061 [Triparma retinervis]|uniref:Uncharacterized protein n=1 Tax=Triparma retinervis TaxID=2557542 RepID=A0A9W6ZEX6_9STRA|nr:hypothetical protein TrRE_jg9061 [Triparma retinervis]